MQTPRHFFTTPAESIALQEEAKQQQYIERLFQVPAAVYSLLTSTNTGAFIRGTQKSYQLPENASSVIAFSVLRICIGEITMSNLANILSSELQIATDKAQQIANEIEKDLIAPVTAPLSQYLSAKNSTSKTPYKGASNVLNLKKEIPPKSPPQIF